MWTHATLGLDPVHRMQDGRGQLGRPFVAKSKLTFVERSLTLGKQTTDFIDICRKFDQAMLVSRGVDGVPESRPLMVARLERSGEFWFVTQRIPGRRGDLKADSEVCVTMCADGEFASVTGHATELSGSARVHEFWNDAWRTWFPDGKSDSSLTCIHLVADRGEFWSGPQAIRVKHFFAVRETSLAEGTGILDSTHFADASVLAEIGHSSDARRAPACAVSND